MRKLTYNLAPTLPSEKEDTNLVRMNRWERAQNMKMSELAGKKILTKTERTTGKMV